MDGFAFLEIVNGIGDRLESREIADTDAHTPQKGHDLRRIPAPERLPVLKEDKIFDPMQIVLNTPMLPEQFHYLPGRKFSA